MKKTITFVLILSLLFTANAQKNTHCLITTSLGEITVELFDHKAPATVANFLAYVSSDSYTNSSFFRTCTPENEAERDIKIEVIQGGNVSKEHQRSPIKIETTEMTGVFHKNGAISMARGAPDSATSSFFICINDQPELDYKGKRNPDGQGFAAFGMVIKGMDIVLKIQEQKEKNQYLIDPIVIHSIKVQ